MMRLRACLIKNIDYSNKIRKIGWGWVHLLSIIPLTRFSDKIYNNNFLKIKMKILFLLNKYQLRTKIRNSSLKLKTFQDVKIVLFVTFKLQNIQLYRAKPVNQFIMTNVFHKLINNVFVLNMKHYNSLKQNKWCKKPFNVLKILLKSWI